MSLSRRAVLTAAAGGLLTGCGSSSAVSSASSASSAPTPTPLRAGTPATAPSSPPGTVTRAEVIARYGRLRPTSWGFNAPGVVTQLPSAKRQIALTFDACGGPDGNGYDKSLIGFLRSEKVPATLFLNSRWIDANLATFHELAEDPLFEIANHGTRHRPLSVSGRSAYHIAGTRDAGEVFDEVAGNRDKLTALLDRPPRFFRSGTAYCDDVAARIVTDLGERFVSFDVNGDGGATFTPREVERAVLAARPGSIIIGHMNHPRGGTARGMAAAVPRLLGSGYRFVRMSDSLH